MSGGGRVRRCALLLGAALVTAVVTVACTAPPPAVVSPAEVDLVDDGPTAAKAFGWGSPVPALSDEFRGSGRPPAERWDSYSSPGHAGNGLRRPSQNTLQDGFLRISGRPDGTSGGMMGVAVQPPYGRWEARARVAERGQGGAYHAVIALIPDGIPYNDGEGDLDFAEGDAGSGLMRVFVHYPPFKQDYAEVRFELADWHAYAVEVAPDRITWFVDGVPRMTTRSPGALRGLPWTANVQLDAYQPRGQAPATLDVDYFRHYPLPDGAPAVEAPAGQVGDYRPSSGAATRSTVSTSPSTPSTAPARVARTTARRRGRPVPP